MKSYWRKAKISPQTNYFFSNQKKIMPLKIWSFYKVLIFWEFIGIFYDQVSAASFVLRRSKKDMNTLQREVIHGRYWRIFLKLSFQSGIYIDMKLFSNYYIFIKLLLFFLSIFRNMVRNVKLGHGLFDLIKTEQAAKVSIYFLKNL